MKLTSTWLISGYILLCGILAVGVPIWFYYYNLGAY